MQKKINSKLYMHSKDSDISDFDNVDFYDNYIYVMSDMYNTLIKMLDHFSNFLSNLIITVIVSGIFVSISALAMVAVLLSVTITVFLYFHIIKIEHKKEITSLFCRRRSAYFKRIFCLKEYAKEIRTSNIHKLLFQQFDSNINELISINKKFGSKLMIVNLFNGITISILLDIGMMLFLSYQLIVLKSITIAEFTASSYGIWSLFGSLNGLIFGITMFPEYNLKLDKMIRFLKKQPITYIRGNSKLVDSKSFDIELRNISFKYKKNADYILKNINLKINANEKIAIVGENGSGKTTLIKLILGLYEPTSGEIYVNGQPLSELDINFYRKNISIVFQDYSLFSVTAAENVLLDFCENEDNVIQALKKSTFSSSIDVDVFNTIMTKEFSEEGLELSGGQKQKLIFARGFLGRLFFVMDEPSSAIDIETESILNSSIFTENVNATGIIISHRLTTAKLADRIIVLNNGKVVEEGKHNELMLKEGLYKEMFMLQAQKYGITLSE